MSLLIRELRIHLSPTQSQETQPSAPASFYLLENLSQPNPPNSFFYTMPWTFPPLLNHLKRILPDTVKIFPIFQIPFKMLSQLAPLNQCDAFHLYNLLALFYPDATYHIHLYYL